MLTLETIVNESMKNIKKIANCLAYKTLIGLVCVAAGLALPSKVRAKADFLEEYIFTSHTPQIVSSISQDNLFLYNKTLESDLNNDGIANFYDLRIFSKNWLGQGLGDLNKDNIVNFVDFSVMAKQWLMREPWYIKYELENATVIEIIDGDTIDTNEGRIRLFGINAPETNMPYYNEAKNYLKEIENKDIGLLRESEDIDRHGRKLRYVFYNNRFINLEILEKGLGICYMANGLKYEDGFVDAERFARENQIGLWERSKDEYSNCIELVELDPIDEYFLLKNRCDFYCDLSGWIVTDNANHIFHLDGLGAGEIKKYESKVNIWNNDGDRFFMRDKEGKLVIFYLY